MKLDHLNMIVEAQFDACRKVLISKGEEYATDIDRLSNFKIAAIMQNIDVEQAIAGMMAKHTVSVYDMCQRKTEHEFDQWNEKITDHINYLLLLKAAIIEERVPETKTLDNYVPNDFNFTSALPSLSPSNPI